MMHGYGEFIWDCGQRYYGYYQDDKKHGKGKLVLADETTIEAEWQDGKIHGRGRILQGNVIK